MQHLHLRLDDSTVPSELEPLRAALNQMLARLEQGFARLSRFSETWPTDAHAIGQPHGPDPAAAAPCPLGGGYQALLVSNQEEYERLARMIDNMLFLARAEQPAAAIERQRFALPALVGNCATTSKASPMRGIQLLDETEGELCGDELIRRALANLVANALRWRGRQPGVHRQRWGGWRRVSVINQGSPIAPEHLPRLFDRFYRCATLPAPSRATPVDWGWPSYAFDRAAARRRGGGAQRRQRDPLHCACPADPD